MPLTPISTLPTPPARTDTPADFNSRADALLGALPTFVTEINTVIGEIPAVVNGIDYTGTSTTSVAIGTGSKSFTTQTGKNFYIGMPVRASNTTTPANYMDGQVTAYDSGTGALTINVTTVGGSGTLAAWTIGIIPASGGLFATLTGSETLTNKTFTTPVLSPVASGSVAGRLGYDSGGLLYGDGTSQRELVDLSRTQTLQSKTLDTAAGNVLKVNGNTLAATAGTATVTLPNSTTTLVGRDTTDTLTNKTLTAPAINGGALDAASTVSDTGTIATNSVGFRGVPTSSNVTGTFALTDNGKMVVATSGWTIPANGSVAFPIGAAILIVNNSASPINLSITTDTLRQSGTSNTGTRSIAAYGEAVIKKVAATTWFVSGNVT